MSHVDQNHVRQRYNTLAAIWPDTDLWHRETRKGLEWGLRRFEKRKLIPKSGRMLDAGSGGETYFPDAGDRFQIDVAERLLKGQKNAVCASVERIPFVDNSFDFVLCVGSVLNYANLMDAILELSRVLAPSGTLVIDVETTNSVEYLFSGYWGKPTAFVVSEYQGESESIWLYSLSNIYATLNAAGLRVVDKVSVQVLSVLTYWLFGNRSSYLRRCDALANRLPGLRDLGTNAVICCQKI